MSTTYILKKGIGYKLPKVFLISENGIGHTEFAGRCAYDSFDKSENRQIANYAQLVQSNNTNPTDMTVIHSKKALQNITNSDLLNQLSWVYHHESVLEHSVLSFYIKDLGRGVLQELARHRIASYTVKSTRYTMTPIIYAFALSQIYNEKDVFFFCMRILDPLIIEPGLAEIEYENIYNMLMYYHENNQDIKEFLPKNMKYTIEELKNKTYKESFNILRFNTKQPKNMGDKFKFIVSDNWSTELIMTMNLRSLKNFLKLRNSRAAWFQMQWVAEELKKQTPKRYRKLITKN